VASLVALSYTVKHGLGAVSLLLQLIHNMYIYLGN
jgi:hypothetical protein